MAQLTEEQRLTIIEKVNIALNDGIVDPKEVDEIEKIFTDIQTFLDSNQDFDKTDEEVCNKLFDQYKDLITSIYKKISGIKYRLSLSQDDYRLMKKLITKQIKYTIQDINLGIKLEEDFFNTINEKEVFSTSDKNGIIWLDVHTSSYITFALGKVEFIGVDSNVRNIIKMVEATGIITRIHEVWVDRTDRLSEKAMLFIKGFDVSSPEEVEEAVEVAETKIEE